MNLKKSTSITNIRHRNSSLPNNVQ